ncbi:sigma-70 family RNA polymerase sigma factor [Edaphobacter albus]|uniref:sigma-70 family RNA polymerase sigma factor n=1 Tax=Edaphobacter sp. 4G125 TaxID=2763071 RepID=UPI0016484C56|nr:sigma-70 family RNA polymerase sigma factor [Edaphobacter sp. 4G125]QNI36026.1 sigma-70 family RNA polymerase sigma factor [Edaphobacter sp. 4G125]
MPKTEADENPVLINEDVELVQAALRDAAEKLRPALHGYCARMLGSTIDGEDAVQDTLLRAYTAIVAGSRPPEMRFWLFRLAHNCSVDLLRKRRPEVSLDMEYLSEAADPHAHDPLEIAMQKESAQAAVSSFLQLPSAQRSTVILKDVFDYELSEIGQFLHMPLTAVKAALHRGRARLGELAKTPVQRTQTLSASPELRRFVEMFNNRDWPGLISMLSEDVHLSQTARAELRGRQQVSSIFYKGYGEVQGWRLQEASIEGYECAAVFLDDPNTPAYFMLLHWQGDVLKSIRDFRYARYVMNGAEIMF